MKKTGFLSLSLFLLAGLAQGQVDTLKTSTARKWLSKNERFKPKIKTTIQLWSLYSMGMEVFDEKLKKYEPVDDRLNIYLRRARLAIAGEPYKNLRYTAVFFYDQTGRDILASNTGSSNKSSPSVNIRDAYLHWKVSRDESLNLIGGWFCPQMQRENITTAWAVTSFEKSMSVSYVRNYLAGTGLGRAPGLNLGGLKNWELASLGQLALNYNFGLFNPVAAGLSGASAGKQFSPLLAGRVSLSLGDPEMTRYGISYRINYFSERKGVSLDFNFSTQGETDLFRSSRAFGPGLLLNWGPLNLDGEYIWMTRQASRVMETGSIRYFDIAASTGHLRLGANIPVGRFVIEPTVMVMQFRGAMDAIGQADAAAVELASGRETTFDAGLNWHLDDQNLRLMLHYTWRRGDAGEAEDGSQVNMYFSQKGVGAIRRGNWAGLGLGLVF